MTQPASSAQLRAIHTLARQAGLDEDTRRDLLAREANGKRSTKDLDIREAIRVIDRLQGLAGDRINGNVNAEKPLAKGALKLDGPFIGKVRALWISGWHLGVVRDRTDAAMVAFVQRQTGIEHPRWASQALHEPAAARKVIEALKGWLERAGGVDWKAEDPDGPGGKRAVYLAIRRALTAAGVDPEFITYPGRVGVRTYDGARLDELTKSAGARLRQAKANPGAPGLAAEGGQVGDGRPGRSA